VLILTIGTDQALVLKRAWHRKQGGTPSRRICTQWRYPLGRHYRTDLGWRADARFGYTGDNRLAEDDFDCWMTDEFGWLQSPEDWYYCRRNDQSCYRLVVASRDLRPLTWVAFGDRPVLYRVGNSYEGPLTQAEVVYYETHQPGLDWWVRLPEEKGGI